MATSTGHEYDGITAYLEGDFRPLADAKASVMTHSVLYGTATFEGIRDYWNADEGPLYALKVTEPLEVLRSPGQSLLIHPLPTGHGL